MWVEWQRRWGVGICLYYRRWLGSCLWCMALLEQAYSTVYLLPLKNGWLK